MNENVKISVIIPVYQVEAYLAQCLDSVLNQKMSEIQVICIDDASPDQCPEILDSYAQSDSRLTVIHLKENRRQGYGRNLGLKKAKGKYIYLLDSDDMIKPETLLELYETAEKDNLDGVFFDSEVLFEEQRFEGIDYLPGRKGKYEDKVYCGLDLFERFYEQGDWNVYIWRQFWNRQYLKRHNIRFPEATEHEDEVFSVEATILAERVRYKAKPYAVHRYRADSVMTRPKSPRDFHGYFKVYRELILFKERYQIHSTSYNRNLINLYELMLFYYPMFKAEGKENAWFPETVLYEEYCLFSETQLVRSMLEQETVNTWEPLLRFDHIYLYGAGRIARRVVAQIRMTMLKIDAIIVTNEADNPKRFENLPVLGIKNWQPESNSVIVIAVAPNSHECISKELANRGCAIYGYSKRSIFQIKP